MVVLCICFLIDIQNVYNCSKLLLYKNTFLDLFIECMNRNSIELF